ncbi:hypothetical protein HK098_008128 [Nowakowskiella sp. JEL0407]|nr:hypothetical protein HK098_008128 [Nowakowskiella sp. JEL0407]
MQSRQLRYRFVWFELRSLSAFAEIFSRNSSLTSVNIRLRDSGYNTLQTSHENEVSSSFAASVIGLKSLKKCSFDFYESPSRAFIINMFLLVETLEDLYLLLIPESRGLVEPEMFSLIDAGKLQLSVIISLSDIYSFFTINNLPTVTELTIPSKDDNVTNTFNLQQLDFSTNLNSVEILRVRNLSSTMLPECFYRDLKYSMIRELEIQDFGITTTTVLAEIIHCLESLTTVCITLHPLPADQYIPLLLSLPSNRNLTHLNIRIVKESEIFYDMFYQILVQNDILQFVSIEWRSSVVDWVVDWRKYLDLIPAFAKNRKSNIKTLRFINKPYIEFDVVVQQNLVEKLPSRMVLRKGLFVTLPVKEIIRMWIKSTEFVTKTTSRGDIIVDRV